MHDNSARVEARVDRFVSERVVPALIARRAPLHISAWQAPGEPVPFADAVGQAFSEFLPGDTWGAPWSTTWFHVTGVTPETWLVDGQVPEGMSLEVVADLGFTKATTGFQAEGLYYSSTGAILKATQPMNRYLAVQPGRVDLYIEAAGNPDLLGSGLTFAPTALGDGPAPIDEHLYTLRGVDLTLRDIGVWELWQDLWALVGLLKELPADSTRRARILRALERLLDVVDPDDVSATASAGRRELACVLGDPASASAHRVFALGHAHIDSAWLWPVRETVRKCARTFANQVALMDENPDYIFGCSSAQQFAWIEERYPELFERIVEKVAQGQFVPMGSMWVESDTNMPGGEAMVRQFVAGKRYFSSRFGIDTREVWLPDSFGYSGALPQIARLAGCDWFVSQKLSWNESDPMPHHTFTWEGIDGSRVLTHFPPVDTYNSDLSGRELLHAERNFAEKGVASASIVPFGWGDGGGGPTREMLAAGRRFADLEGSPTVRFASAADFFRDAEAEYVDPPVWSGEMYLEFHRGTYTSQARTKQGNRRSEHLLHEAEALAATAAVRCGAEYPYEELERIWETVLLHQFHDILPGSAIGWVHRQAEETYADVAARLETVIAEATSAMVGEGDERLLVNTSPHRRDGVPALGIGPVGAREGADVTAVPDGAGGVLIDNAVISLHLTPDGTIDSLIDLRVARELIPVGAKGNLLQLHRDTPRHWDAWDIEEGYQRVVTNLTGSAELHVDASPDQVRVRISREFSESRIEQSLVVSRGSAAVEIVNDIDWRERQKLLKLSFPCDLMAERSASETQFGHVFRPTHQNTSWDAAKFEICAQRWVHVAEGDFGVAVANSATYGHDISRVRGEGVRPYTQIRLSLLHSPVFPDPAADHGRHRLVVTLHPGASLSQAIEDGYRVNLPDRMIRGARAVSPLVRVSGDGLILETLKLAHDGSGDVIVRLYESRGQRCRGRITIDFEHESVTVVDLLEMATPGALITADDEGVALELRPFEITTLRISR